MGNYTITTDYLYARPSFLSGAARALDMGTTLMEFNRTPEEEADAIALHQDWLTVGAYLRLAMRDWEKRQD